MKRNKESSLHKASPDNLAHMPKETAGQRVKYLLAKHGMTQREFSRKMYGDDSDNGDSQYTNINAKLNDKRTITQADAEKIAKIFPDVFPQFILYGGYENNADMLADKINEINAEGDLLNTAFLSLITLSGMKVRRLGINTEGVQEALTSLHEYVEIEKDGRVITLSAEQLNKVENIIFEHSEVTIKHFLDAYGKEVK